MTSSISTNGPLTESQLHLAVEQLRTQHPNTLDLYKAVAALLFFQYDSTPTTNRMYQLVRKGSMSAPAEALRLFWQELRDRSQVRMEQADIPQNLKQSAGALMAQLWEEALAQALQITEQNNQVIYTQVALAEQTANTLLNESKKNQNALLLSQQQLQRQDEKIEILEKNAQKEQLLLAKREQKIQSLEDLKLEMQQQHEKALLVQKEQMALSEKRAVDMEKYARLEIDRVRQEALKDQKQSQQQLTEQKQKTQSILQQYQEQQQAHITLQQDYRYLQKQHQDIAILLQQTERQNQELHALLQQLQPPSLPTTSPRTPSRLAKLRIKKPQ